MKELTYHLAMDILKNGKFVYISTTGSHRLGYVYRSILGQFYFWSTISDSWLPSTVKDFKGDGWEFMSATDPSRKTENLTLKEARVALAEGFEVANGSSSWVWNKHGIGFKFKYEDKFTYGFSGPGNPNGKYSIVQPKPELAIPTSVPLNYDQAVEAIQKGKTVNIQMPTRKNPTVLKPTSPDNQHQISVDGLLKLDLASRKGYDIWTEE